MKTGQSWVVSFDLPKDWAEIFAETLADLAGAVSTYEEDEAAEIWRVRLTDRQPLDLEAITRRAEALAEALDVRITRPVLDVLPDRDWVQYVYDGFKPIVAGPFYIHTPQRTEPVPDCKIELVIDAATAFGTGNHGSTHGCLLALGRLQNTDFIPKTVLDMGCGTGILGIAAAKLWPSCCVLFADSDPEAVRLTDENTQINGVAARSRALCSEGYAAPEIAQSGAYGLIFANILAAPLIAMAPDLAAHLAPKGKAIVAGLLNRQADSVIAAHEKAGLHLSDRIECDEWTTLIFQWNQA